MLTYKLNKWNKNSIQEKENMFITLCTFMRKRRKDKWRERKKYVCLITLCLSWEVEEKIGGEESRILLYHIYSFTNKQVYLNHKEEKRRKDRQEKDKSPIFVDYT